MISQGYCSTVLQSLASEDVNIFSTKSDIACLLFEFMAKEIYIIYITIFLLTYIFMYKLELPVSCVSIYDYGKH